ncbi:G-PROTEIN-RECEP-F1-2 domain-containing protein [Aphelenchoides besseyi]|nr:G-PROTEIN-RECEP-F1-2 domain-containing protein [Aphelenchoides besseyi]KAI6199122.1 G-PROTEIN-RECEP-F1-2 domain-containing protein [Aphelenchoides besseyi]
MNDSTEPELFLHPGFVSIFPDIMADVPFNVSDWSCICPDIQENDYSPLYSWFNYVLIICLLPWLSVFGLLTNVANIFIFSRKSMANSANTYLLSLACSDFLVILTGVFIFWIDSARSYVKELARAPYLTVYALPLGYMAQTCSIYFTVAAAVDCYVNVCWKSQASSYCTVKRARQITAGVAIASIFYNSLRFPQFNLRKCLPDGSQEFVIEICPTQLFFLINTFYNVYLYMALMTLLPFFFLLVLNVFIMAKQQASSSKEPKAISDSDLQTNPARPLTKSSDLSDGRISQDRLSSSTSSTSSFSKTKEEGTADAASEGDDPIVMIMVVILFLCCNTLALIVNLIETFLNPDQLLLNLLSDASNFLVVFNSSVNALIYFIFNPEYRELFIHYYVRCRQSCCGDRKSRDRPPHLFYQTAPSKREVDVFYPNVSGNSYVNVTTKANGQASVEPQSSPIWRAQKLSTSLIATTKLSPCDSPFRNGNRLREVTLHSPSQSFVPSIQSEILLMDDETDWADGACSLPSNGTCQRYLAEVKILDDREDGPQIIVKPLSGFEEVTITPV